MGVFAIRGFTKKFPTKYENLGVNKPRGIEKSKKNHPWKEIEHFKVTS